ncbi:MAG TPA: MAPEG family protein [Steroidobacteraceae bacterium]|nr:MAPEG family protein [Steroidobacteraceae bacterium]
MPTQLSIFWPMCAQVLLTAIVWAWMYVDRIGEMRSKRIAPQSLPTAREAAQILERTAAADNFRNLFEVPVLFYVLCLALAVAGLVTPFQLGLAWLFVALRALHTFIHITYNRVSHRFTAHLVSTLCVLFMWGVFAIDLSRR